MQRTKPPMKRTKYKEPEIKKGFGYCQDCQQREAKYMTFSGKNNEKTSLLLCEICAPNHVEDGFVSWRKHTKEDF